MVRIRKSAVAGSFYEADPGRLRDQVDLLLAQADDVNLSGSIRGLVSPHAGYIYSGPTAAVGYKAVSGKSYDSVIMIGPSHREFFDGASVFPGDAYRTPLGDVPIDVESRDALLKEAPELESSDAGHRGEHCLEVQLPFLQRVLHEFSFVPIIIGNQKKETCLSLGSAIARASKGKRVLVIASSDLSHYHPYNVAIDLDRHVIDRVEAFDELSLMAQLENDRLEACGGGPVVAAMRATRLMGADRSRVLSYCNSGDTSGDKSAVVGYLSAAFLQAD
jgi:MEMO1 family protein